MWYKMKSCMYINIVITVIYRVTSLEIKLIYFTKLTFLHKLQVGDEIKITIYTNLGQTN